MEKVFEKQRYINCGGHLVDLSRPHVMGILNVTPDSFYDGGRYQEGSTIKARVRQIVEEGGTMVDIGAYSSRPGAEHISEKEEMARLIGALEVIRTDFPDVILSVDTFRSKVAQKVVKEFNVGIINDISGGEMDPEMGDVVAELGVPYILMHMKGTPQTMQEAPTYENLIKDICRYFAEKVEKLRLRGVRDVILDPGFGFGKSLDHNYELLKRMDDFKVFGLPLLVGVSRKSMIYKFLEQSPQESLNGTTVLNTLAVERGANILRVHDVRAAVEVVRLVGKMTNSCLK